MKKVMIAVLSVFLLLGMTSVVYADEWKLLKNVRRLESVAPDYKEDREADKKFLEILDLTERTRKDSEIYAEAKRIAMIPALAQSKYMDSFQYYMLVKSITSRKSGIAEQDYWLNLLKAHEKSPHLLAAYLVHMKQLPKDSANIRTDALQLVDWVKAQKPEMKIRAPEYGGNMLMGYKPRSEFAEGDYPKLYSLSYYKSTVTPPAGFFDEDLYVAVLDRIKDGREDVLSEMSGIYKKMGKRKEASELLYQVAELKVRAKDFQSAKTLLDEAVKLNHDNAVAVKERDRIKLELTYQSLAPVAESKPEDKPAAVAPAEPVPQGGAGQ